MARPDDGCSLSDPAVKPADEHAVLLGPGDDGGASFWAGVANLGASVLGISIISMPLATAYAGYLLAPLIIGLLGLLTDLSLCLLIRTSQLTGADTFAGLGQRCFGAAGDAMVLATMLSLLLGCAVATLLVVAQLAAYTCVASWGVDPAAPILQPPALYAAVLAGAFPIALLPSLSALAPISGVALLGLLYVVLAVIAQWAQSTAAEGVVPVSVSTNLYSMLSISASAYICHFNILPVYSELRPSARPQIFSLIHIVIMGLTTVTYIVFGLAGYLQLGPQTFLCSNVLLCFSNPFIRAGASAIGVACFLKFPLLVLPFRATLNGALLGRPTAPFLLVLLETGALFAAVHALALSLGDVGRALALLGATAGTAIMFILPGLFYAQAKRLHAPKDVCGQLVGMALAVMGCLLMGLGVSDALRS